MNIRDRISVGVIVSLIAVVTFAAGMSFSSHVLNERNEALAVENNYLNFANKDIRNLIDNVMDCKTFLVLVQDPDWFTYSNEGTAETMDKIKMCFNPHVLGVSFVTTRDMNWTEMWELNCDIRVRGIWDMFDAFICARVSDDLTGAKPELIQMIKNSKQRQSEKLELINTLPHYSEISMRYVDHDTVQFIDKVCYYDNYGDDDEILFECGWRE